MQGRPGNYFIGSYPLGSRERNWRFAHEDSVCFSAFITLCVHQIQNKETHMSKAKKSKSKTKKLSPSKQALTPSVTPDEDGLFRAGTLYQTLFAESDKIGYLPKSELLERVASITGKSLKVCQYAYAVLKSPGHRSNKNRCRELTEGDKVKLVAIHKPAV